MIEQKTTGAKVPELHANLDLQIWQVEPFPDETTTADCLGDGHGIAYILTVYAHQMAIAGAIGTGLIIGSGTALKNGGPGSMLIGYVIMGFIVYIVMVALGEMGAWLPHKKSFSGYASRFVDPALGYVCSQS